MESRSPCINDEGSFSDKTQIVKLRCWEGKPKNIISPFVYGHYGYFAHFYELTILNVLECE